MNKKKCIPVVEQMLRDRGYDLTPIFGDDTVQATNSTTGETVHVHFVTGKKKGLGVGDVRAILEETPEDDRLILVYESNITYYAKQAIQQRANVETFQAKTLYYNVTKHVLVPPHRLLARRKGGHAHLEPRQRGPVQEDLGHRPRRQILRCQARPDVRD